MAYRSIDKTKPDLEHRATLKAALATEKFTLSTAMPASSADYDAPGGVGDLNSAALRDLWNAEIANEYAKLTDYHSRFFTLDHSTIAQGADIDVIRWSADPAEAHFCFDVQTAQDLADWRLTRGHPVHAALSSQGRRQTHNEYCEYRIIFAIDANEKLRAKRVVFTTELREYWQLLATHSPVQLAAAATEALGRTPSWSELYGPGVVDPNTLSEEDRKLLFATWVSGAGGDSTLMQAGAPIHPLGRLNNLNALFMTHQINGLDDLLYIVLYGAHPYARNDNGKWVKASKDEIFSKSHFGENEPPLQLACRHADPAAALGAAGQAFEGKKMGFANPLGMYILGFASDDFLFNGAALPSDWIRFSRGKGDKFFQRLEFGPPDNSANFLDEITVGDEDAPLRGGYQIAQRIEVGPWLRIGASSQVSDTEYQAFEVERLPAPYSCAQAGVCRRLGRLRDEYDEWRSSEI